MKRKWIIVLHLLVWVLIVGQETQFSLQYDTKVFAPEVGLSEPVYFIIRDALYRVDSAIVFYGVALWILPLFFKKKKYFNGVVSLAMLLVWVVLYRYLIEFHVLKPYLHFDNYMGNKISLDWYIKNCLLYNFTTSKYALYAGIYFFITGWYSRSRELSELENQRSKAELLFLRYQISPHFLFNAINDIYSLSVNNKHETSLALMHLSSMLRYILPSEENPVVPLDSEVCYIKDYIELQRISYQDQICIDFHVYGTTKGWVIPRLILIPFIENAFKHGNIRSVENPVSVSLTVGERRLKFNCKNEKLPQFKDSTSGIGLANVKRRLALVYPEKHELIISQDRNMFKIELNIYQ